MHLTIDQQNKHYFSKKNHKKIQETNGWNQNDFIIFYMYPYSFWKELTKDKSSIPDLRKDKVKTSFFFVIFDCLSMSLR